MVELGRHIVVNSLLNVTSSLLPISYKLARKPLYFASNIRDKRTQAKKGWDYGHQQENYQRGISEGWGMDLSKAF